MDSTILANYNQLLKQHFGHEQLKPQQFLVIDNLINKNRDIHLHNDHYNTIEERNNSFHSDNLIHSIGIHQIFPGMMQHLHLSP